jgi:hypothetical protein
MGARSGKQCRERWIAHLSPEVVRQDWSPEEDLILVQKQGEFGNHWAKIRAFLPGRSVVAAKNRWNWLARRNIPKQSGEFEVIAKLHTETKEVQEIAIDDWAFVGPNFWGAFPQLDFDQPW